MEDKSRTPTTAFETVTGYPAVTGYPMPAKPECNLFIRLVIALLIVLILVGPFFIILGSVLPQITVFHVSSLSLSNFNTSTSPSFITGNWDMKLVVENTDEELTLYYKKINASLFYKDVLIVQTTLPEFDLAKKNQTVVSGRLATAGTNVNTWVVDDISKDRSNGSVRFHIELHAYVQYKRYMIIGTQFLPGVKIYCAGLELGLTEVVGNASLVGNGERKCIVTSWHQVGM